MDSSCNFRSRNYVCIFFLPLPHLNQPFLAEMSVSAAIFCTNNGRSSIMLLFGHQIINRATANTPRKHQKATQGVLKACVSTCEHPKNSHGALRASRKQKYDIFGHFDGFTAVSRGFRPILIVKWPKPPNWRFRLSPHLFRSAHGLWPPVGKFSPQKNAHVEKNS